MRRKYVYGHLLTVRQIKREYPYQDTFVDKIVVLSCENTVTFDVFLAYKLRQDGYNPLIWGGIYRGKRIFIIEKKRKQFELPFG